MVILPNLGTFEEKHIKNSIDAYINTYFSVGYFKSNKEFKLIYFVNQEGFYYRVEIDSIAKRESPSKCVNETNQNILTRQAC